MQRFEVLLQLLLAVVVFAIASTGFSEANGGAAEEQEPKIVWKKAGNVEIPSECPDHLKQKYNASAWPHVINLQRIASSGGEGAAKPLTTTRLSFISAVNYGSMLKAMWSWVEENRDNTVFFPASNTKPASSMNRAEVENRSKEFFCTLPSESANHSLLLGGGSPQRDQIISEGGDPQKHLARRHDPLMGMMSGEEDLHFGPDLHGVLTKSTRDSDKEILALFESIVKSIAEEYEIETCGKELANSSIKVFGFPMEGLRIKHCQAGEEKKPVTKEVKFLWSHSNGTKTELKESKVSVALTVPELAAALFVTRAVDLAKLSLPHYQVFLRRYFPQTATAMHVDDTEAASGASAATDAEKLEEWQWEVGMRRARVEVLWREMKGRLKFDRNHDLHNALGKTFALAKGTDLEVVSKEMDEKDDVADRPGIVEQLTIDSVGHSWHIEFDKKEEPSDQELDELGEGVGDMSGMLKTVGSQLKALPADCRAIFDPFVEDINQVVRCFAAGRFLLSEAGKQSLRENGYRIYENAFSTVNFQYTNQELVRLKRRKTGPFGLFVLSARLLRHSSNSEEHKKLLRRLIYQLAPTFHAKIVMTPGGSKAMVQRESMLDRRRRRKRGDGIPDWFFLFAAMIKCPPSAIVILPYLALKGVWALIKLIPAGIGALVGTLDYMLCELVDAVKGGATAYREFSGRDQRPAHQHSQPAPAASNTPAQPSPPQATPPPAYQAQVDPDDFDLPLPPPVYDGHSQTPNQIPDWWR